MPNLKMMFPENAPKQFKCSQCGVMFTFSGDEGNCPACSYHCTLSACQVVDASDEGY